MLREIQCETRNYSAIPFILQKFQHLQFCFMIMIIILTKGHMVAAGIASHLAYFKHGEHHMYGARYVQIFLALYMIAVVSVIKVRGGSISDALFDVLSLAISYLGGV